MAPPHFAREYRRCSSLTLPMNRLNLFIVPGRRQVVSAQDAKEQVSGICSSCHPTVSQLTLGLMFKML